MYTDKLHFLQGVPSVLQQRITSHFHCANRSCKVFIISMHNKLSLTVTYNGTSMKWVTY